MLRTDRVAALAAGLAAALAAGALPPTALAGETLRPSPGDLKSARPEALERNAPIVLLVMLEGEEASERFRRTMYESEELAAACRDLVVLVANDGLHERKKIVEEGEAGPVEVEVCAPFLTSSCTDHQRVFDQAFLAYNQEGRMLAPQLIVTAPDGTLSTRLSNRDVPPMPKVLKAIEKAREEAGPTLDAKALVEARLGVTRARRAAQARDAPAAWREWLGVLVFAQAGPHALEAREGAAAAEASVRETLAALQAKLVPGSAAEAWERLAGLAERCDGLPIERELKRAVREAERSKEIRDEIAARKLELEARAVVAQIEAALAAGEERKAERLARGLFRSKKLADTEASRRARERWPKWAEDAGS